jgi:POTRA domain, FtsQ-type
MRSVLRVFLWVGIAAGAALSTAWAPDAMAELEYFRATDFRLEGGHRLTLADVLDSADMPPSASVWDDPTDWARRIQRHPLVLEASVRPDYPNGLVFEVVEREPVALYPTPLLEPIDREGKVLPIDPAASVLDLPILSPHRGVDRKSRLTPVELRILTREAARLNEVAPGFLRRISELSMDQKGDLVATVATVAPGAIAAIAAGVATGSPGGSEALVFRFSVAVSADRLEKGWDAYADATARRPGTTPGVVDLRFAGQVVLRYTDSLHSRGQ